MKALLVFISISLGLITSSYAVELTANAEETATVIQSLENPSNLSASMLKAALGAAKESDLKIDLDTLKIRKLEDNRYQLDFYVNNRENVEKAHVRISEMMIRNGKAYVFGYDVERVVPVRRLPGVSMGNR